MLSIQVEEYLIQKSSFNFGHAFEKSSFQEPFILGILYLVARILSLLLKKTFILRIFIPPVHESFNSWFLHFMNPALLYEFFL
jgi:hypothetical protein